MSISEAKADKLKENLVDLLGEKINGIHLKRAVSKISLPNNLEQLEKVPTFHIQRSRKKKENRLKSQGTSGKLWFNMPRADLDHEQKRDLNALRARSGLDLKNFYRKTGSKEPPNYMQVGQVVNTPEDFYSDMRKKETPTTFVEQILKDHELRSRIRKRHKAVVHIRSQVKKPWKHKKAQKKIGKHKGN